MKSTAGMPASRNGTWSSETGKRVVAKRVRTPEELSGRDREERVQVLVGVLLVGDLQVAVANHVEQDHRPDRGQRRRPLFAPGARVVDVLAAPADAVAVEVALAPRLLAVEGDQLHGGPGEARRQRASELEQDGDAGGAVVGTDEARHALLGVVVGADDDGAREAAGDGRDHVAPRALDRDPREPGLAPARGDQLGGPLRRGGAPRARPELDLRGQVGEGSIGVETGGIGALVLGVAAPASGEQCEQCERGREAAHWR